MNDVLRLKKVIRRCILENLINEAEESQYRAGEEVEALEKAAKEEYEAAEATLDAWRAAKGEVDKWKASPGSKAKKGPAPKFPQGTGPTSEPGLVKRLEKAKAEYEKFRPDISGYAVVSRKGGAKSLAAMQKPEPGKAVIVPIENVKPLTWYEWPKQVNSSGFKYGSRSAKVDDATAGEDTGAGTGPGEEWLAYIFGGQVQGGGVSYDVVTPDSRAWEVKQILSSSETIRPGTEGLKAYAKPAQRMNSILKQIKNFGIVGSKPMYDDVLTSNDRNILNFAKAFVEDEYEMIVSKGEFSNERKIRLMGVLKALKQFKENHSKRDETAPEPDTRVALNDKEAKVDKPTFVDIAKKVEKATGDNDIISDFESIDILLSTLKDSAFDNPTEFLNEWYVSVDIRQVFSQVDGVFIVNPRGYLMVPKSMFKKAFRFDKVTQGKPRFSINFPFGP